MAFEFKRTGDDDYPRLIKAVVQGSPKSGKTTFLSTFPNIVVADVEHEQGGLMSIAHKNVPYVAIDSSTTLRTLKTILGDDGLRAKAAKQLGMEKIESVGIDTLDEYQRILKAERLAKTKQREFKRDDWGWLLEEMRAIINGFVALPVNVVFTVHTKLQVIDEDTSIMVPALQGAIGDELPGMVGFALETTKRKAIDAKGNSFTQYALQAEGDEKSPHLGNRAGGRLPRMIEPDFAILHAAVYKGLELAKTSSVTFEDNGDDETPQVETPVEVQAAPEDMSEPPPTAPGAPKEDTEEPISKGALQHLQGMYQEFGQVLPPSAGEWSMGKGRDIARYVVAVKTDMRSGQLDKEQATAKIVEGLQGMDAWVDPDSPEVTEQAPNDPEYNGGTKNTVADVIAWVGQSATRAHEALRVEYANKDRASLTGPLEKLLAESPVDAPPRPVAEAAPEVAEAGDEVASEPEVPEPEPEAPAAPERAEESVAEEAPEEVETPVEKDPQAVADEAEEVIKQELGAERIANEDLPPEQRPCDACGKPSEDPELSELAEARYGKWLCVDDYLVENAAQKKAKAAAAAQNA